MLATSTSRSRARQRPSYLLLNLLIDQHQYGHSRVKRCATASGGRILTRVFGRYECSAVC
jgi:hypothetical protein